MKKNEISLKEYKKYLVNLLKYIDKVCRSNNINYSLIGGSLIGAIRHKGMIPWDDDIDIILDTNNYNKLIKTLKKDNNQRYKLLDSESEKTYYYPYAKLVDTTTDVEELGCKKINNYGIFLDIFCYHNAPKRKITKIMHYYKIQAYKIVFSGYAHKIIKKEYKYSILKKIGKIYANIFGIRKVIKKYNRLISKYDKKDAREAIANWPVYGWKKEYQNKEYLNEYIDSSFEKINVKIYKRYDPVLRTTYGDYMKLPDEEERVTKHSMKAIRL